MEIDLLDFIKKRGIPKRKAASALMFFNPNETIEFKLRGDGWPELKAYRKDYTFTKVADDAKDD